MLIDSGVRFRIWRHIFKMTAMTSFREKPLVRFVWRHFARCSRLYIRSCFCKRWIFYKKNLKKNVNNYDHTLSHSHAPCNFWRSLKQVRSLLKLLLFATKMNTIMGLTKDLRTSIFSSNIKETWAHAVLPVDSGGLGVRLASDVALLLSCPRSWAQRHSCARCYQSAYMTRSAPMMLCSLLQCLSGRPDAQYRHLNCRWTPLRSRRGTCLWWTHLFSGWCQLHLPRSGLPAFLRLHHLICRSFSPSSALLFGRHKAGWHVSAHCYRTGLGALVCVPHTCICGKAVDTSGTRGTR